MYIGRAVYSKLKGHARGNKPREAQHDMAQHATAQYGTAWYGTAQYGTAWRAARGMQMQETPGVPHV